MIYDKQGNPLNDPDLTKGYLIEKTRVVHHDAKAGVREQSHLEVAATYPNGGMDVRRVIDVQEVPSTPAWYEEVPYQLYIPYTDAELAQMAADMQNTIEARLDQQEAALIELAALIAGGGV